MCFGHPKSITPALRRQAHTRPPCNSSSFSTGLPRQFAQVLCSNLGWFARGQSGPHGTCRAPDTLALRDTSTLTERSELRTLSRKRLPFCGLMHQISNVRYGPCFQAFPQARSMFRPSQALHPSGYALPIIVRQQAAKQANSKDQNDESKHHWDEQSRNGRSKATPHKTKSVGVPARLRGYRKSASGHTEAPG